MTDRERLIELFLQPMNVADFYDKEMIAKAYADRILADGWIRPLCKPTPVMSDGNPFNSDVYCPFCGANLSGFYGDEPTSIIQCYGCGEFLDNTKSIAREEAKKALKERETK